MTDKQYISVQDLLYDSFKLAKQILNSNFKPNFIIAIWRGGTPIGIAVQEFLKFHKIETNHIAIRTSAYENIDRMYKKIEVHGMDYIIKTINSEDKLLIVDDVYDTGLSIQALLDKLKTKARKNTPNEIKIATVYYKPKRNKTKLKPDFYIYETDKWLIFPHELEGLKKEEIQKFKPEIGNLFK